MSKEIILMLHPTFGVLGILAAVWIFVEVLNTSQQNLTRIKLASSVLATLMWLSFLIGGYWYVTYYGADKAIIKAGPWPFAHSFFMETKEHLFFTLLLLSSYVPIAASGKHLLVDTSARNLMLLLTGLVVLLGLAMEGSGATVGLGVKMGLLGR
jgi:hypothetical protein